MKRLDKENNQTAFVILNLTLTKTDKFPKNVKLSLSKKNKKNPQNRLTKKSFFDTLIM